MLLKYSVRSLKQNLLVPPVETVTRSYQASIMWDFLEAVEHGDNAEFNHIAGSRAFNSYKHHIIQLFFLSESLIVVAQLNLPIVSWFYKAVHHTRKDPPYPAFHLVGSTNALETMHFSCMGMHI